MPVQQLIIWCGRFYCDSDSNHFFLRLDIWEVNNGIRLHGKGRIPGMTRTFTVQR